MFKTEAGANRELLAFEGAALGSFNFLRSYGLKPVTKNSTFVRYQSKQVFVNVYHGRTPEDKNSRSGARKRTPHGPRRTSLASLKSTGPCAMS
ncbi:MAG: hypothetical protein LAP87_05200 [Acidobacteriia bacterium]|nr:hypothetical protein [Terriglobia bacterium]